MDLIYYITFLAYIILSIISVVLNVIYSSYRKKGYQNSKIKYLIVIIFISLLITFSINNAFFLIFREIINNTIDKYMIVIIIFNISTFFILVSSILFLQCYFDSINRTIELEKPSIYKSRSGKIKIGKVIFRNREKYDFFLSKKDLERHMFICGASGTGKSNFLQNFLINFEKSYKIPFFLVEFKGEHQYLQKKIKDTLILWPGKNFSINIFDPFRSDSIIHAERIFDILKSGRFFEKNGEFSPQMEKTLVEILINVCKDRDRQNWDGFEYYCNMYKKKNSREIPMLEQTLISIKNRIRRYSKGPLKGIFENKSNIDLNLLFNSNVILDLSSIIHLGGEKEDAIFFLNMLLKFLWDKNILRGSHDFSGLKHLTIIEDAQYFAPNKLQNQTKITTYLEDIALLLRGTGEGLITIATRPNISREILANCGVVVFFKTNLDKDFICEILNLEFEKRKFLSFLPDGHSIVRVNSIEKPFLIGSPFLIRKQPKISQIIKNNKKILRNINKLEK